MGEYQIKGFEIDRQAVAVLAYLEGSWWIEGQETTFRVSTAAWYNGREDGYSLTVHNYGHDNLIVTFGECRNSDAIFVDHWLQGPSINPPTVKDFSDEAYSQRHYFNYGQAMSVAEYIRSLIEKYIKDNA